MVSSGKDNKIHKVYVYGTLRPSHKTGDIPEKTYKVPGKLFKLGWYPGIKLMKEEECNGNYVVCEQIEVDSDGLRELDQYEGCYPDLPPSESLYLRTSYLDGWIYTYNRSLEDYNHIESGDWMKREAENA